MLSKQVLLKAIAVCLLLLGIWENIFPHVSATQSQFRLWFLTTDETHTNARLVAFDVAEKQIADEVVLPPGLTVASVSWSPDRTMIAAVVGEWENNVEFYGKGVCVFSAVGETVWCRDFPILNISSGGFAPAPITWLQDSQQLYIVTVMQPSTSLEPAAQVLVIDVKQEQVASLYDISFADTVIDAWLWSPYADFAAIRGWNRIQQVYELYVAMLSSRHEYSLVASNVSFALATSQLGVLYGTFVDHSDDVLVEIATLDENGVQVVQSLGELKFNNESLSPAALSISSNGNSVALVSTYGQAYQTAVFVLNLETNELLQIVEVDFTVDQLTWSPDNSLIAARVCEGPGFNNRCHIDVFSLDGTTTSIDTGFPENRDPMWVSIES